MAQDLCVPCGEGFVNLRVGAIIQRDGKLLMVGNNTVDYLYSVGGRIRFGETAEQAVVREVEEETGYRLAIDRLGFVHENYFVDDQPHREGKTMYEIAFFYYMQVPEGFDPVCSSVTENSDREFLVWVSPAEEERPFYPAFFRTALDDANRSIRFFSTDAR